MERVKSDGELLKKLSKYKIPLIALMIGLLLLLIPTGKSEMNVGTKTNELAAILEQVRGVGEADALVSENGAIIVCDGADDPEVRLNVFNAVEAYTGFSCDKIQVLIKDANQGRAK